MGPVKDAWLSGNALSMLGEEVRRRKATGRFWAIDSFERSSMQQRSSTAPWVRPMLSVRPPRCSSENSPRAGPMSW